MISVMPRRLPIRRHNRPLAILVAATLLLAMAGSALSAFVFAQGVDEPTRRASAAPLGRPLDTSFGSVTLDYVEHVNGLSEEDMGGAMPGMTGMVHADSEQVIAWITYRNNSRRPLDPSPDSFRLISDTSDTPVAGTGTPLGSGAVQPGSALETTVRFVIPRDEANLWLEYRDPGNGTAQRFALGTAQQAPADGQVGTNEHTH